jgi:hypothetical protein
MDDDDLQYSFQSARTKYWIKYRLLIPDNVKVVFRKVPSKFIRHTQGCIEPVRYGYKITVDPLLRFVYWGAHVTLLHEMAHLYTMTHFNTSGHGEKFKKEIDRLYEIGAFRYLI